MREKRHNFYQYREKEFVIDQIGCWRLCDVIVCPTAYTLQLRNRDLKKNALNLKHGKRILMSE